MRSPQDERTQVHRAEGDPRAQEVVVAVHQLLVVAAADRLDLDRRRYRREEVGDGQEPRSKHGRERGEHAQYLEHRRELLDPDHGREVQVQLGQADQVVLLELVDDETEEDDREERPEWQEEGEDRIRRAVHAASRHREGGDRACRAHDGRIRVHEAVLAGPVAFAVFAWEARARVAEAKS